MMNYRLSSRNLHDEHTSNVIHMPTVDICEHQMYLSSSVSGHLQVGGSPTRFTNVLFWVCQMNA